jgi:aspartokinase-like uncharacterized kinase
MSRPLIAKVGGSLFDLPDLKSRLQNWLKTIDSRPTTIVAGGGPAVDVVRNLHSLHHLSDELSHWMAVRMMTVTGTFLAGMLDVPLVGEPRLGLAGVQVLDVYTFLVGDEGRQEALPHGWDVSSDAIAARVAEWLDGDLVLMKSIVPPPNQDWPAAARAGCVDAMLPPIIERSKLKVEWVNLRQNQWAG